MYTYRIQMRYRGREKAMRYRGREKAMRCRELKEGSHVINK